jgi:hypothetical protein
LFTPATETGLAVDDGAGDARPVHDGVDGHRVKQRGHARLGDQRVRDVLEHVGVDRLALRLRLGAGGTHHLGALLELDADALAVDGPLAAVPGDALHTDGGDVAAQAAVALDHDHRNLACAFRDGLHRDGREDNDIRSPVSRPRRSCYDICMIQSRCGSCVSLVIAGIVLASASGCSSSGRGSLDAAGGAADGGQAGAGGAAGGVGGAGGNGGACAAQGDSCASGQTCCAGLTCCAGVPVPAGQEYCGATCPRSDRNIKQDFAPVDREAVLEALGGLPIQSWSYKAEDPAARHIGPMAQDFMATFHVGSSDKTILQVDADGVALAALQALTERVKKLERRNAALERELQELRAQRARRALRPSP